ncbi:hypothetical protein T4B_14194 [Trichinella pseudospiralis]|uniref:Uncharacterized protein n=2 Tax=Trichinella pseudospiralis TaxID=6337 RepID=A0A0V1EK91_TRIPS|nr:hypothetical protein T4A_3177 [Trichinella pseudospiralis]KRY74238.1 hypothetical protein T4A_9637 [Trichinella pseudospiralis]KRY81871.1 hypothetical protein T4D_10813 [Trichinella pseudospiralis]KRZ10845.1 hypothetical protein T4B_14194 [Trichinella pseudospiralis]KRZ41666.1 hypothetical protein T4C_13136 [Trichinella pseudospiralis]
MAYLNHFTNQEVASNLFEVFFTFSRSGILQSDNGQNSKHIGGVEACHVYPQIEGVVERLNDKLAIWIVQETTGQSPLKVTFGEGPPIGMESFILPKSSSTFIVDAAKQMNKLKDF